MKLAFMATIGLLFILIGLSGKLGSLIGSIIDPINMQDTSSTSNGGTTIGGLPTSGTLNATQIRQYASQAGFSGNNLIIAVAIALAESGGNTSAIGHNSNGTTDRGLWQINSIHTQYDQSRLLEPLYNAQAAFSISGGGTNFVPWVTFTSGKYQQFISQVRSA